MSRKRHVIPRNLRIAVGLANEFEIVFKGVEIAAISLISLEEMFLSSFPVAFLKCKSGGQR